MIKYGVVEEKKKDEPSTKEESAQETKQQVGFSPALKTSQNSNNGDSK